MRYVIAVCGRKGGIGKSSVALNLAHAIALRGHPVVAFDLDPQPNMAATVGDRTDLVPVRAIGPGVRLEREMPKDGVVILDTPPGVTDQLVTAIAAADLVLLPMPGSVRALVNAADLVDQLQATASPPRFMFLLNAVDDGAACRGVEEELRRVFPRNICKVSLPRSAWFERATATGRTVLEAAPKSRAADAVRRLAKEVLTYGK